MNLQILRCLGAVLFASLVGSFTIGLLATGYFLSWTIEGTIRLIHEGKSPLRRLVNILRFLYDFVRDLTISNVVLAWDVLTPRDYHRVTIVKVPIEDLSDPEVALLCQRITLTPGTLACGISHDRRHLYVHAMYSWGKESEKDLRRPIEILKEH